MVARDLAQLTANPYWRDPVTIIGANPVGLITALGLARYRIPSVIIEEGAGNSAESYQCSLLDQSTLEILGMWSGLGAQLAQYGVIPSSERVLFRKSQIYRAPLPASNEGVSYPRLLTMHHVTLEQLLLHLLQQTGLCYILWQHQVSGLAQDREGVDLELISPVGKKTLRAPYVIATQKPPSSLHNFLPASHTYTGQQPDQCFLLLDLRAQLEVEHERWFWFDAPFNPDHLTQAHPLPGGHVRLMYQFAPDDSLAFLNQPGALQQRVEATIGKRPFDLLALNIAKYQRGVSERFMHGRVLLLGHAAHTVSPFGTGEVNMGAQDAWNVVWKLALVRAGLALDSAIDTYADERRQAALAYLERTEDIMSFLAPATGFAEWRRNTTLRLSLPFKFLRDSIKLNDSPGAPVYSNAPVFSEDHRLYLGGRFANLSAEQSAALKRFRQGPLVGTQAPSFTLLHADTGQPISLLERFGQGFVALCFTRDVEMAISVLRKVPMELSGVPIGLYIITPTLPDVLPVEGVTVLLDAEKKGASAYNAGSRTLYVIRPDRVIAARRFDSDFKDIPALLRHAVGEDVVDTQTRIARPKSAQLSS